MKTSATTWVLLLAMTASSTGASGSPAAPAPRLLAQVCANLSPFGLLPPTGGFTTGCSRRFNLKLGGTLGPDGNYMLFDYPSCASGPCAGQTGTAGLSCQAVSGYQCCVNTSDVITTLQGTNVGLLTTGLNTRISGDSDSRSGICFSEYTGNGSRVLKAPFITAVAGSGVATVIGFGEIFLTSPPTGTGNSTTFVVEFLNLDPTPALPDTWGRVKQLYR